MSLIPMRPEQLAKALFPGLKAITHAALSDAVLKHTEKYIKDWLAREFETSITSTVDPDGNLVFLIKVTPDDLVL